MVGQTYHRFRFKVQLISAANRTKLSDFEFLELFAIVLVVPMNLKKIGSGL
jgi:hypothetical protein